MKKYISFLISILFVVLIACNDAKKEDTNPPAPVENTPTPGPKPENTPPPAAKPEKDHTTVTVTPEGVGVSTKKGGNKTNVKFSKDTASLEIQKPK